MPRIILPVLFAQLVVWSPVMAAELAAAQRAAICQTRASCQIGSTFDGGKSATGSALTVVAVHLGLKDKPDDAPDDGCRADAGFDGGVEYWLLDGTAPAKQLLKLCNDGYGAAGVGEDDVTVGPNRLVHTQLGGSSWRWQGTVTFTLSPWRAVAERDCSYHNISENNGSVTDIDYRTGTVRSIAKDSTARWNEPGCPTWPSSASGQYLAQPGRNLLGAYNIVTPNLGGGDAAPAIPAGTAIGDCVPAMTTAGTNGFVVFGHPAPPGHAAELRVIAESLTSLLVQVFDPDAGAPSAPAGGSWINLPHIEIWLDFDPEQQTRVPLTELSQIGVDLSGKVYAGAGRQTTLPSAERWQAHDAAGRPVVVMRLRWPKDAVLLGTAIVYSQAEAGRQARLVSSTGIVGNHPLYVPEIVTLGNGLGESPPGGCAIRDGQLSQGTIAGPR
jgi:hypothetical protein